MIGLDQSSLTPCAGHFFLNKTEACQQARRGMAFERESQGICSGVCTGTEPQRAYPSLARVITSQLALGTPASVHPSPTSPPV